MTNDDHSFSIPAEIAENLNEIFPDFGDLSHEEVIQHQESVYQSLKGYDSNKERRSDHGQSSNSSQFSGQGESSRRVSFDSQLALDEAMARSLQDLEDGFDDVNISESTSAATENREVTISRETPATSINQTMREDAIDPDDMTYEQLQSLGESVGSENRGLSEGLIDRLPKFKYRTGLFSKKKKEECVICYMMVKNGEYLTTLPCAHQYHTKCINRWLQLSKNCPICQKEVTED